jgi:hypothetical protein
MTRPNGDITKSPFDIIQLINSIIVVSDVLVIFGTKIFLIIRNFVFTIPNQLARITGIGRRCSA